jgi:flagellar protein FliO/FliZ
VYIRLNSAGIRLLVILVLLFLPVVPVLSQQKPEAEQSLIIPGGEETPETSPEAEAPGAPLVSTWDFLRMLLVLAAVVAVIYAIAYLLKRGLRRQLPQNDLIRVLGSRSLNGSRALHLVQLGRKIFLVGAAESGISLISEIKDEETLDTIRVESSRQTRVPQGFAQFLQSFLKSGKPGGTGLRDSVDFMKQQRQRLSKM